MVACSDGTSDGIDAAIGVDAAVAVDAAMTDALPADTGLVLDTGVAPTDAGAPTDAALPADSGPVLDAGSPILAVLDERCSYQERVGLLTVADPGGNGDRYLQLGLADRPQPFLGPPALTDSACVFHRAGPTAGCACQGTQVCSYQAQCVDAPVPAPSVEVTIRGASTTQRLAGSGLTLDAQITVPDVSLELQVVAGGLVIDVPAMQMPAPLVSPMGRLTGTYDAPRAVDLTWRPQAGGASVSTLIRINHHVGTPTFTECVVTSSTGRMHIDEAMLAPLAVSTGLEFQGLEHVRYARADTPQGCFEVRFTRTEFVGLD